MDDADATGDGDTFEAVTGVEDEPTVSGDRTPVTAAPLPAATRYVVAQTLGRGGMGEVLAARDHQLGRDVAIKRMLRTDVSDRSMQRFFREASIQGRLDHPAIVPVHELGIDGDGRPFFVMKKLSGTSMSQRIGDPDARRRLLRAFAEVCLAVEFAHTRGVVHRDLKPDNIVLGEFGEVYVIDWGVAKVADHVEDKPLGVMRADTEGLRTVAGMAIGTPGYMAPEQARGARDVDGRADVYSLGCILFEILTGTMMHPRGEAGLVGAVEGVRVRPSTRAPARDVPPELDTLVWQATEPDRDGRIATARELGERVQLYLDGDRDLALRHQLAVAHFVRAQDAFAARDAASARADAMREAGRALALEPGLAGAAELLGRLMLEPPAVPPPDVEREFTADNLAMVHRHSTTGMRGFIGYAALAPALVASGTARIYAVAIIAVVAAAVALLARPPTLKTLNRRAIALAGLNALLIGLLGRTFSPFLIAPGIATVTASALVFGPRYERGWMVAAVAALLAAAMLLPWLGEMAGWLPATSSWGPEGVTLVAPGVRLPGVLDGVLLAVTTIAMVFAAAGMSYRMCAADRALRRKMLLQAWQLRQLVPTPTLPRESREAVASVV
jgi:hypothetical protein